MLWAQLLAYVTGAVDQELLLRNEYLAAENRILKARSRVGCYSQRKKKPHWRRSLTGWDERRWSWYRRLIANKLDGSRFRKRVGRPRIAEEIERLVVRMAKENPNWGYDRSSIVVGFIRHQRRRDFQEFATNKLLASQQPRIQDLAREMLSVGTDADFSKMIGRARFVPRAGRFDWHFDREAGEGEHHKRR